DERFGVLKDHKPSVFLIEFGDNTLKFELRVWTLEMTQYPGRFKSELNFAIEKKFREAGIAFGTPQREVVVSGGMALKRREKVSTDQHEHANEKGSSPERPHAQRGDE